MSNVNQQNCQHLASGNCVLFPQFKCWEKWIYTIIGMIPGLICVLISSKGFVVLKDTLSQVPWAIYTITGMAILFLGLTMIIIATRKFIELGHYSLYSAAAVGSGVALIQATITAVPWGL